MTDDDDDFLARWSRRKRAVAEEEPPRSGPDPEPLPADALETEPETEEEEAALLERLGLPVPETLAEGDDFSVFMKAGVPQFLQKRALRVLWRSNPVLANLDGLNDYDDDFTSPELTQKVLATGYQVGRGFVSRIAEKLEEIPAEEIVEEPETVVAQTDAPVVEKVEPTVQEDDEVTDAPRPRRMRFET